MNEALKIAVNAADDKKAHDLVILDITKITSFANYFLLCTGDSSRQMQAIADEIEKKLKAFGLRPAHVEGYRNSEWILMDYMDMVVHIFSKNARIYYDLERLWRDGKKLDANLFIEQKEAKPGLRKATKSASRGATAE
jgi:ribosome-associated protein